ncbi:RecT family recombinase [Enterococcus gallinarum]|uniref:recombinase RecT n=1 Tax=Enterococcus gallinarum TaxID=1353 RepID=UPI0032E370D3
MANDLTQTTQRSLDEQVIGNLDRLKDQGLEMPPSYSPQNALKSAFFELTNNTAGNLLQAAANNQEMKTSISNALLDMVIQGLSPAKKQCYFIKYGNKVQLMRSYFGTMAVLDRVTGGADITPVVVRKGDDFQVGMDGPNMVVTKHDTSFENLDNEIVAAYVVIKLANGKETTTVMTKKQIDQSWSKSKMKGSGPQKEFPEEMAKRTVINRAAKGLINTSNDNDLFVQAAKDTLENEFDDHEIKQAEPVKVQTIENKLQRKMGIKQAEPVEQDHTVEDLMKPKETIEQEPEEQSVDLESLEEADPVQEDLGIIPNFDREDGADDEGILKEEDYPF